MKKWLVEAVMVFTVKIFYLKGITTDGLNSEMQILELSDAFHFQ